MKIAILQYSFYLKIQSRAIGCLLVLWNWFKSFIRFCEHVNNPVASHINSHPLSSDNRFLLSVSCFIIWQYTSSRKISYTKYDELQSIHFFSSRVGRRKRMDNNIVVNKVTDYDSPNYERKKTDDLIPC